MPDPTDESYQNSYSTINALMGNPLGAAFAYPAAYSVALNFQVQYEASFDSEITLGVGDFVMQKYVTDHGVPKAIANMDFDNVMFIMTLFEWGGLRVKDGSLYVENDVIAALDHPMSSDHMEMYCKHLHNLYMYITLPPIPADVIGLFPGNVGLYNENSQGMCGVRTSLKMMEVARTGGYSYLNAVYTLFHGDGFGSCLFRKGSSPCSLRR